MKISVLTPSLNAEKYIERAIKSVLAQGYENVEHIVADGGSTDGTVDILKSYPHVRWISEKDAGQSDAMNKAFDLSTGDIIVYLNTDDSFEEGTFASVRRAFEQLEADIIVGNGIKVLPTGDTVQWYSEVDYHKCLQFYTYGFPLNPVSYFYRRKVQTAIRFNVSNHYTMDYEFLLRAFQLFPSQKLEQNFGYFYQDGTNKTADENRAYQELKKTVIKHCLKYDLSNGLPVLKYFLKRKWNSLFD